MTPGYQYALLQKFPSLDLTWSPEIREKWFSSYEKLKTLGGNMALAAGQRVTTSGNRTGVVALDLTTSVQTGHPGVIVLYADSTYTEEVAATLTNVAGGWISGTGPGA